jgi:hypothetical protein
MVLVASVVNASQVPTPVNGIHAGDYRRDLAHSLSVPNGLLFRLSALSMAGSGMRCLASWPSG